MADILNIPSLGKLEIVETYAYYDQPVLFSCRNAAGHLYLVVAADENNQYDTWLYAPAFLLNVSTISDLVQLISMTHSLILKTVFYFR